MEWVDTFIGIVGGGVITTLVTLPSLIKKARGEARSIDLDNLQKAVESWKELADERQEANQKNDQHIKELNEKIDSLYIVNSEWRDKYNAQQEEISTLKIQIATNEVKLCIQKGCKNREPQSGY
ncbi:MAG: hypothetical protein IKJ52_07060 [Muribaculaceae bacterium]|nr:hypothetical protein [Muribaculaceae bacterium]